MNDQELSAIRMALDTLKQPASAYLDESDFEADRLEAVEKLLRAMKIMGLVLTLSDTETDMTSDCSDPVTIIVES